MFSIFWPFRLFIGLIKLFFNMVVLISCALTITAMMGDKGWLWSLSSHFIMQYLAIQLIALLIVLWNFFFPPTKNGERVSNKMECTLTMVFLLGFVILNATPMIPYYVQVHHLPKIMTSGKIAVPDDQNHIAQNQPELAHLGQSHPENGTPGTIKLMHLNLFGVFNRQTEKVIQLIRSEDPTMLDLVEYSDVWPAALQKSGVLRRYPYRVTGSGNIALYSRIPLRNTRYTYAALPPEMSTENPHSATQANIIAQFTLDHQPVTILVAHPASPIRPSHLHWLQMSFEAWIRERKKLGENLILVGDLNTTPWSKEFQALTQGTGLRDSQLGFGLQPSWPMLFPIIGIKSSPNLLTYFMMIPIDHVLVSDRIQVLSRHTGPFVGSDHLPVLTTLSLKPAQ